MLKPTAWLPKSHFLAIAIGTLAIGGFTTYVIRQNYQAILDRWRSELNASVRYQNWALQSSLQQSKDDAQILAEFTSTRDLLVSEAARQASAASALQRQVSEHFEEYRTVYEYDAVYLLDAHGRIAVQTAEVVPGNEVVSGVNFEQILEEATRGRRFVVNLAPNLQHELILTFMMPVFAPGPVSERERASQRPIGVVVIADRFARDLLPLLTAKRVGSRTGETVLLQLGSGVGHYAARPENRINVSDTLRQDVASALDDRPSFGRFIDYRGVDVLAAMERINSINSVVVYKVDASEALSDFRRAAGIESLAAVSILLAYIGLILMHNRGAVARAMREGLERQQFVNHLLEETVSERTRQLAQTNQQLQRELSDRQSAEEEVRKLNTELDQRVTERTAELEVANKELEAFSYSVSHDLRGPVRRMRGFSSILLEEHAPQLIGEARHLLEVMNKNAVQMGELIDCLLAFSQLGRQPLCKQEVAPAEIVQMAWHDLSSERTGREADLELGELGVCEADPLLLRQVFINLLSNALKYSRTREIAKVEVGCTDTGAYYVRDNGIGFDMRYRDKLFGVFKRLHRPEEYEGVGIGLAIVDRIVQKHGGRVWADAMINQGATFYFTLREGSSAMAKAGIRSF